MVVVVFGEGGRVVKFYIDRRHQWFTDSLTFLTVDCQSPRKTCLTFVFNTSWGSGVGAPDRASW